MSSVLNARGVAKYNDFGAILETVQDMRYVAYKLSIGIKLGDLE